MPHRKTHHGLSGFYRGLPSYFRISGVSPAWRCRSLLALSSVSVAASPCDRLPGKSGPSSGQDVTGVARRSPHDQTPGLGE